MYIYMGKRKPKLCRMKRLNVSPKTFFFLLKMNHLISPLLILTFFTDKPVVKVKLKTVFSK